MNIALSNSTRFTHRLAVYGSLVPGGANHAQVAGIAGEWQAGTVTGHVHRIGAYPALEWDPHGPDVRVHVLTSPELPAHWARLDAFEGEEYERTVVPVKLESGEVGRAHVYVRRRAHSER